jgi:hypothetical protein
MLATNNPFLNSKIAEFRKKLSKGSKEKEKGGASNG